MTQSHVTLLPLIRHRISKIPHPTNIYVGGVQFKVNLTNTPDLQRCLGMYMVDHNVTKSVLNTVTVLWCRAGLGFDPRNSQFFSQILEDRNRRVVVCVACL